MKQSKDVRTLVLCCIATLLTSSYIVEYLGSF